MSIFPYLIRCSRAEFKRFLNPFKATTCLIPTYCPIYYNLSSNMVAKRQKSTVSLEQDDHPVDKAPRGQPSFTPRRSERNTQKQSDVSQSDSTITNKGTSLAGSTQPKKKMMQRPDVMMAIGGLREMEDNFRNDTKRQKTAVDASHPNDSAFFSRLEKSKPDFIPAELKRDNLRNDNDKERRSVAKKKEENGEENSVEKEIEAYEDGEPGDREEGGNGSPGEADAKAIEQEGSRAPPVNSDYLPLPWEGRLGYACLNTYLRLSNPPVFSSRTCRIASILEHRHPLKDPSQPEHPTKNRPDKDKPADVAKGQKYIEALGLANARDIVKMIRWNDKYGIRFMRLSSEMFPFASHEEYGYKLAPFASEVLAEAGRVAAELDHRLTTHPGQFTQLGSPRTEVVRNAIRDLEYHNEMLTLLRLPEQLDKDAVMILHMGGVFGDKEATLDRFRENYGKLSPGVKARLVLENDDVSWTVHDLLPICEELNIPFVLDFHHHNIMFDKSKIREGTKDIMELYPRIRATWDRKGITQKMHYSEPCSEAITPRQRRKHRPRVMTLPPCPNDTDLMIEAKDKEQAVFDLMRNFKLPGWDRFNDVIPYEREDENRPIPKPPKKKKRKTKKGADADIEVEEDAEEEPKPPPEIPESELGMGGPNNRVYWPVGMEEWLRPKKREVKKKRANDEMDGDD
ncbi:UV-endonuclease UvdE [Daldinia vernicosa]|uniref:UV-endonuclease UvdE n=1 Tax=Daldinia vernicosa TaxID=114800 RepID=UPI0020079049|nr:UV-endonuclease UvdE [Daldinia vernicosa]KAI0849170.1 UV-endonuclease UvdE [Daldinia vernicosa]